MATEPRNVAFVAARREDGGLVLEMMREYYAYDGLRFDETVAARALDELLADQRLGEVWLITSEEARIGYCVLALGYSLEFGGRDAFVDEIYVRESHRRRGIGRRAIAFLEGRCAELGVRALHLEVERANVAAQRLYSELGFADHDRYLKTKPITRN